MTRYLRWSRVAPAAASIFGALMLSGPASGVEVPEVGVPDIPPLVPPVETPQVPEVQAPVPPPVAVPEVQQLVEPSDLQGGSGGSAGQPSTGSAPGAATRSSGVTSLPPGVSGSPSHGTASGSPALAASAAALRLSPAQRRQVAARRRAAYERRLRSDVKDLLGCVYAVSDFEAAVLVLRAGVSGKPLSRARVAKRLRTSRTRVRRAERRGLRRMRSANRRDGCAAGGGSQVLGSPAGRTGDFIAAAIRLPDAAPLRSAAPFGKPEREPARDARDPSTKDTDAGAVAGVTRSSAPPTGDDESAGVPFLLLLLAAALLASLLAVALRAMPAIARAIPAPRPKPVQVQCDFCRSTKVAVNPAKAVYRCANCGFSGVLPTQMTVELGNMQEAPNDRGAPNPTARH